MSSPPQHGRSRATAGPVRCYRSYSLHRGGTLLALGRTQWAVLGTEKKLMQFAQTGFPADFPFSDHTGITDRPTRFADDLTQAELVRGYTVRRRTSTSAVT